MVLGHISDSDKGQLQTEDARLKWGKQFAESFLEEPLRVFFIFFFPYLHLSYNYVLHRYAIPLFIFFQDLDIVLSDLNKNLKEDNRIGRELI